MLEYYHCRNDRIEIEVLQVSHAHTLEQSLYLINWTSMVKAFGDVIAKRNLGFKPNEPLLDLGSTWLWMTWAALGCCTLGKDSILFHEPKQATYLFAWYLGDKTIVKCNVKFCNEILFWWNCSGCISLLPNDAYLFAWNISAKVFQLPGSHSAKVILCTFTWEYNSTNWDPYHMDQYTERPMSSNFLNKNVLLTSVTNIDLTPLAGH